MPKKAPSVYRLVADVAAIAEGHVVLVKYRDASKYDGQVGWFLPDDFLRWGEHPSEAASRILREQTGLAADRCALNHIESFTGGPEDAWHLIFHHRVDLPERPPVSRGPNVADAKWFPLGRLPPKRDVSHGGWAIDVLKEILGRS